MSDRLQAVLASIDEANSLDPVSTPTADGSLPRALVYGQRMTVCLDQYRPDASDELRIAARAQHIERWTVPRNSYPEGRVGYLTWRKDLQKRHAARTGEIMRAHGFAEEEAARVGSLLRKERLKQDHETQTLEDVACLVFLQFEAADFIAAHDDAKVRDILTKTARKMSPEGLAAAGTVPMGERLSRLLGEALNA